MGLEALAKDVQGRQCRRAASFWLDLGAAGRGLPASSAFTAGAGAAGMAVRHM